MHQPRHTRLVAQCFVRTASVMDGGVRRPLIPVECDTSCGMRDLHACAMRHFPLVIPTPPFYGCKGRHAQTGRSKCGASVTGRIKCGASVSHDLLGASVSHHLCKDI